MLSPTGLVTLWKDQLAWSAFFSLLTCDCSEHQHYLVNHTERTSNSARNQMSQLSMSSGWIGYKFQAALSAFKHNLSCREIVRDSLHFKSDNWVKIV